MTVQTFYYWEHVTEMQPGCIAKEPRKCPFASVFQRDKKKKNKKTWKASKGEVKMALTCTWAVLTNDRRPFICTVTGIVEDILSQ